MKRKIGLSTLIILTLVLIVFHIPREVKRVYSVSLQTNEEVRVIELEAELSVSKRLFTENKIKGNITIQGHTYRVHNHLDVGKLVHVGQMIQKVKGSSYRLIEMYYDKESNSVIRPLAIHISRDLSSINGTIIEKDQTDPIYFQSQ